MWHVGAWIQIQRYQYQALKKVYQPITDLEYIGDRTHARKISPLKTWSLTQRVDSNHVLLDIKKHMVGTVCAFPRWPPCPPHSNGMFITRLTICYEFETCASQTSRANRSTTRQSKTNHEYLCIVRSTDTFRPATKAIFLTGHHIGISMYKLTFKTRGRCMCIENISYPSNQL